MKKKLGILLLGLCLISASACAGNTRSTEADGMTENTETDNMTQNTETDAPSLPDSEGGFMVIPGVYQVGDYISGGDYRITCEDTDYTMQVVVFESKESYDAYQNTKRTTNGEERTAIEQNALYDYYLEEGESGYLSLGDDSVLFVDSGSGRLAELSDVERDHTELLCGVYFVGKDIEASRYLLACTETDYSMRVVVFESRETYQNYHRTSRFTTGEELAAIEQNAWYDYDLDEEETGYLNLADGYVLLIYEGKGALSEIHADSDTAWYSDENTGLCKGVYFVGNDLDAAQYSLTCTDRYMQAAVFENTDTYRVYHQSDRFTTGEENEAIEKNAILYEEVYEGEPIAIHLQEGNVLLVSEGAGMLETLGK